LPASDAGVFGVGAVASGGNLSAPFWPQAAMEIEKIKAARMKTMRRMANDFLEFEKI
jgi:hypothetical protein